MWLGIIDTLGHVLLRALLGGDGMADDLPPDPLPRTIHDVETDLAAARYAQKRGPMRAKACDVTLRDVAVNALLEEWGTMHAREAVTA